MHVDMFVNVTDIISVPIKKEKLKQEVRTTLSTPVARVGQNPKSKCTFQRKS